MDVTFAVPPYKSRKVDVTVYSSKGKQLGNLAGHKAKEMADAAAPKLKAAGHVAFIKAKELSDRATPAIKHASQVIAERSKEAGEAASREFESRTGKSRKMLWYSVSGVVGLVLVIFIASHMLGGSKNPTAPIPASEAPQAAADPTEISPPSSGKFVSLSAPEIITYVNSNLRSTISIKSEVFWEAFVEDYAKNEWITARVDLRVILGGRPQGEFGEAVGMIYEKLGGNLQEFKAAQAAAAAKLEEPQKAQAATEAAFWKSHSGKWTLDVATNHGFDMLFRFSANDGVVSDFEDGAKWPASAEHQAGESLSNDSPMGPVEISPSDGDTADVRFQLLAAHHSMHVHIDSTGTISGKHSSEEATDDDVTGCVK